MIDNALEQCRRTVHDAPNRAKVPLKQRCNQTQEFLQTQLRSPATPSSRCLQAWLASFQSERNSLPLRPLSRLAQDEESGSSGDEARGRGGLGALTAGRKCFKAPSHRRSGSRSPAFASSMIFRATASRIGSAWSGVARSDPSAISKAMPIKRTVSPSKLWPSKNALIGIRRGSGTRAARRLGRRGES
jgi:hypothetical protein